MANLHQAGEAVQHLAKQYKAVIELGAFLEKLGALENLEAELLAKVEAARAAEAAAVAKKEQADKAFADTVAAHEAALVDAKAQLAVFKREAEDRAKDIIDSAEREAERIHEEAHSRQEAFAKDHTRLQDELKRLEDQVAARVAELVRVNNALNEVRAKFS